jgi:DNA-binding phage protein
MPNKTKVNAFSANTRDLAMLEVVARYHGMNKSATITSLIRKEFWRVFPGGTDKIKPDRGAKVEAHK